MNNQTFIENADERAYQIEHAREFVNNDTHDWSINRNIPGSGNPRTMASLSPIWRFFRHNHDKSNSCLVAQCSCEYKRRNIPKLADHLKFLHPLEYVKYLDLATDYVKHRYRHILDNASQSQLSRLIQRPASVMCAQAVPMKQEEVKRKQPNLVDYFVDDETESEESFVENADQLEASTSNLTNIFTEIRLEDENKLSGPFKEAKKEEEQ